VANLENKSFSPDNICIPPGRPVILGEFPTGTTYVTMNGPGGASPPVFTDAGSQDYDALFQAFNDFSQQMFTELQNIKSGSTSSNVTNITIEDIGVGDIILTSGGVGGGTGNTNINVGGNTTNVGGATTSTGGNTNQFFGGDPGDSRPPVIPAMSKTKIAGRACGGTKPGVGMVNLLYRQMVASITEPQEDAFVALRDAIHAAKISRDWDAVQALAQIYSDLMHDSEGMTEDPLLPPEDDSVTQMALNMSDSEIAKDTHLLVSPDFNGDLWVVVEACGECE
jgi:hypothetical protein